jgi:hypothetical protein
VNAVEDRAPWINIGERSAAIICPT